MSSAGPGRREVAHRLFAREYDDATLEYAESDEERAPNYVVTPSGTRINRLFVVGVLTAVEQVNEDTVRARIADPTGAFVVYAGQYQPDELAALQSLEAPAFVALTGKANTFSPEGSDRVLTSVRPESVTAVDAETRDRWVSATAEHTLARIQTAASALQRDERGEALRAAMLRDGVEPGFAEGVARAIDHYGTTADYLGALRDLAIQSLEVVAGERSEVESPDLGPAEGDGTVTASDLAHLIDTDRQAVTRAAGDVDVDALLGAESDVASKDTETEPSESAEEPTDGAQTDDAPADPDTDSGPPADTESTGSGSDATESDTDAAESDTGATESSSDAGEEAADRAADADDGEETDEAVGADDGEEPYDEGDTDDEGKIDDEGDATQEADRTEETEDQETAPGTSETADEGTEADAERAANDEIYEFDEEEREQIEEEHGVEFQSGAEVEPAGEADIETEDTPPGAGESDEAAAGEGDGEAESGSDAKAADEEAPADDGGSETDGEPDDESDADLEAVLVEEMGALDDGDGADREALIDAVADQTGADTDAIDDAIDDLLMSGQCYEPSEGTLKTI